MLIFKISKETYFFLMLYFFYFEQAVKFLFSGFKLIPNLFDGDAWLSNLKKRHDNHCQNIYCIAIFPLDDYHCFNLIFESSFKNTIPYTIMFFMKRFGETQE